MRVKLYFFFFFFFFFFLLTYLHTGFVLNTLLVGEYKYVYSVLRVRFVLQVIIDFFINETEMVAKIRNNNPCGEIYEYMLSYAFML